MRIVLENIKNSLKRLKMALNINLGFYAVLLIIIVSNSCASIQQPTGGPRDTIPPVIVEELPENLSTNFSAEEIEITFDEYVKLENEFSEISISPEMQERPTFKIKKKSLIITLPDSLETNTTYTINFGNALVDFNESNKLRNYYYVFSTGNEIDSLTISGNVKDAFTLEPKLDATVMLIPIKKDSIFRKHKATIFTRTDSSGNFRFRNQREGTYRIYALVESDNDRIFNKNTEKIAFLKDSIHLKADTSGITLDLFKEIPEDFRTVNRSIQKSGVISIGFNKKLKEPGINILNDENINNEKWVEFDSEHDSVTLWINDLTFDSLSVQITDSNKPVDTVTLKRNKSDKYEPNIVLTDNLTSQKVNRIEHLQITSSAPIGSFDRTKIKLLEDSVAIPKYIFSFDTSSRRNITIAYPWKKEKKYQVSFEENAITGLLGNGSEEYTRNFSYDESENFGDFIINLQLPDTSQYIVDLVKLEDGKTLESRIVTKSQHLKYKNLPAIKLGIRVIYDANENNKWDTGDVRRNIYPERVWYYDKLITIRPNWEQEELVQVPQVTSLEKSFKPKAPSPNQESNPREENNELEFIKKGVIERKDSIILKNHIPENQKKPSPDD